MSNIEFVNTTRNAYAVKVDGKAVGDIKLIYGEWVYRSRGVVYYSVRVMRAILNKLDELNGKGVNDERQG